MADIKVISPDGMEQMVPQEHLQQAQDEGFYVPPAPEAPLDLKETTAATLQGAGEGLIGPAFPALVRATGMDMERYREIKEAHPVAHGVGEVGGLLGGPLGEGIAVAGKAIGGNLATRLAAESALMQASDEASKAVANDPDQTLSQAIHNIGTSALIGHGLGMGAMGTKFVAGRAVDVASKTKIGQMLGEVWNKAHGVGPEIASTDADLLTSGVDASKVSPELRAAMSGSPVVRDTFAATAEGGTKIGQDLRQGISDLRSDVENKLVGGSPAAVKEPELFNTGEHLKKHIEAPLISAYEPIAKEFEEARNAGGAEQFWERTKLSDEIGQWSLDQGHALLPEDPGSKLAANVLNKLTRVDTVKDAIQLENHLGSLARNPTTKFAAGRLKGMVSDAIDESLLKSNVGGEEAVMRRTLAKEAYNGLKEQMGTLGDRLGIDTTKLGPKGFLERIQELQPEVLARRALNGTDRNFLELMKDKYPQAFDAIRQHHLDELFSSAIKKASAGQEVNTKYLFNKIESMEPSFRDTILPIGYAEKAKAAERVLDSIPARLNPSGTARTLESRGVLGGVGTAAALALSGHPILAGVTLLKKSLTPALRDGANAALLKFLASGKSVNPEAFVRMAGLISAAKKGEQLLTKSVQSIVDGSRFPDHDAGNPKRLDEMASRMQADPVSFLGDGHLAHYMPEHSAALGNLSAQSLQYLNSQRPKTQSGMLYDSDHRPSSTEMATWNRTLSLAEQPLVVLKLLHEGRITTKDIQDLNNLHPQTYEHMKKQLYKGILDSKSRGKSLPYKTRLHSAAFLGQPLDSTMTPAAIMGAQMAYNTPQQAPEGQPKGRGAPKKAGAATAHIAQTSATPLQAREARNQKRA